MDDKTYFAMEALSQSGAKTLLESPARYKYEREHARADTNDYAVGRLVHCLVLEPTEVGARFSTGPDLSGCVTKDGKLAANPAATTEGKAIVAAWYAANPDLTVLSAADFAAGEDMAWALLTSVHPALGMSLEDLLMFRNARTEVPLFWTSNGCPCKAKLDAAIPLADGSCLVVDVKTTRGALTNKELTSGVANFGYHRQAAWYLEGLADGGCFDAKFWFVFVSKVAPYETAWVTLDGDALTTGAQEMRAAKEIYAACQKSGVWPSAQACGLLGDTISLPKWYKGASNE